MRITALDPDTRKLTDEYRRVVAVEIPDSMVPLDAFWCALEVAIVGYYTLRDHRPTKLEMKRWRKINKLAGALGKELNTMCTPERTLQGDTAICMLLSLAPIQDIAEAHITGHHMIHGAFQRRRDPHRWFLFGAALDLWRYGLGQPLHRSETYGEPGGPLFRFLMATIGPVLGDEMLKPGGVVEIIRHHGVLNSWKESKPPR